MRYEIDNEIPQAIRMKNSLKAPGNKYEIDNEIPQAIRMKFSRQ